MKLYNRPLLTILGLGVALSLAPLQAAVITSSKGNVAPGFNDGDAPDAFTILAAQSGQPAPFDGPCGNDSIENCDATWTFTYAPVVNPILSASITIGIVDADGFSTGDQVGLFVADSTDATTLFNAIVEAGNHDEGIYGVYTLNLPSTVFAALADGSATFQLTLKGPVQTPNLFDPLNPVTEDFNGAALIFSTLQITTQDTTIPDVPEPSTYALLTLGLGGMAWWQRRRK